MVGIRWRAMSSTKGRCVGMVVMISLALDHLGRVPVKFGHAKLVRRPLRLLDLAVTDRHQLYPFDPCPGLQMVLGKETAANQPGG